MGQGCWAGAVLCHGWCFILSLQGNQADFSVLLLFPRSGRLICGGFREVELWGREELLSRVGEAARLRWGCGE